jgi:hypothetical protein
MKWVIVFNAGTNDEQIISIHRDFLNAVDELKKHGGIDKGYDLMMILPDGSLTTEF